MLRKHWMRHTAMVPKGFIRYQVLESISKKPMSGSEIMDAIEQNTDGHWRPSPGSIYPLLAWLQDNGYVKEQPTDQTGMKRYELTEKGKTLLDEQRKIMEEQRKTMEEQMKMHMHGPGRGMFFGPPFGGPLWMRLPPEKARETRDSMRNLMRTVFELGRNLHEHFSTEAIDEARKVLDETTAKLQELNAKLEGSERKKKSST